jgi:2-polyprenyl-6-methoxyphenol hydroxylase-like FAD-dependent oxidoreductase
MTGQRWDAVVVGARAAGAATAMLMARGGMRVLVVDKVAVGTDTLSTHQVQLPGVACLARWGLLDRLVAAKNPAARRVRFDMDGVVLEGGYPTYQGVDAVHGPRRTLLDPMLVDAARGAGAEVRDQVTVAGLCHDVDGRVTGVRVHGRGGDETVETASLVVGADGKGSTVAREVGATAYRETPALSAGSYTYWAGLPVAGGEIYGRPGLLVGAWPTDDGLTVTYVGWPSERFDEVRRDPEAAVVAALDRCGDLGERARSAARAEPVRSTPDLPNRFRTPYGPGWALVGDAGLVMDPIMAYGIGHAFCDAERLAAAALEGGGDPARTEPAMAAYQQARDAATMPAMALTLDTASFAPLRPEQRVLLERLSGDAQETSRFLGVLTGAVSPSEYFGGRNVARLLGLRGMARVVRARVSARRR